MRVKFLDIFANNFMAKYKKRNNNAKKIKQATKDYGTESRSNIEENIHQLSSSDINKDSNSWYHLHAMTKAKP